MEEYYWARLAPYNPQQGCVVRRHVFKSVLYNGGERPTWYKVTLGLARELVVFKQNDGDPRSPALFEIFTNDQRLAVDTKEDERALVAMGLHAATAPKLLAPVVSMDLTQGATAVPVAGRAAALPAIEPGLPSLSREDLSAASNDVTTATLPTRNG